MSNTPNIRFSGFTEAWEQRKLGEYVTITSGESPSKFEEGAELYVKVDDLNYNSKYVIDTQNKVAKHSSVKKVLKGSVVFPKRGAAIMTNKVRILGIDSYMDTNMMAIFSDDLDSEFLYNVITKEGLYKIADTSTIPQINNKHIEPYQVIIPNLEEQVRIGGYFKKLDNLITLHQRKCDETKELKKYMLKKMFPQNGAIVPEIRFEGFTDAWEQRKLGEICERVTRKNKNNESDLPLTIASQHGLIDQRDFFNKVVAAKDMSNYYLLKKGEFAYNKSYSNGFDYGSIKRLNAYEQGCLSTLYICFGITSDEVESDYLECFFDTLKWYGDVSMICAEGARNHGLLNVDTKGFFDEVTIDLPKSLEEQKKISAYLNALDNLVTLHQRKCDELKEMKSFMLQNMFPKEG